MVIIGGQYVQVSNQEKAFTGFLQFCPGFQSTDQMADMPGPRGTVTSENTLLEQGNLLPT
jgi:hypothetical protein